MNTPIFFGDSLTGSRYGVFYGQFLNFNAIYRGIDGQKLNLILQRAIRFCTVHPHQIVIIEGGANDILQGSVNIFKSCKEDFKTLSSLCEKLFVCTISPIGENPSSSFNKTRLIENENIRNNAASLGYICIDIASNLDSLMSGSDIPNELLKDTLSYLERDRHFLEEEKEQASMKLSVDRNFNITIDGLHFNWKGAKLFANAISNALFLDNS